MVATLICCLFRNILIASVFSFNQFSNILKRILRTLISIQIRNVTSEALPQDSESNKHGNNARCYQEKSGEEQKLTSWCQKKQPFKIH